MKRKNKELTLGEKAVSKVAMGFFKFLKFWILLFVGVFIFGLMTDGDIYMNAFGFILFILFLFFLAKRIRKNIK